MKSLSKLGSLVLVAVLSSLVTVALMTGGGALAASTTGKTLSAAYNATATVSKTVHAVYNTTTGVMRVPTKKAPQRRGETAISWVGSWTVPGVAVPNVVGSSIASAQSKLAAAGFAFSVVSANSSTVPIGRVISQSPVGGALAAKGSIVRLVVSTGPAMPSVVGLSQEQATATLENVGLSLAPLVYQNTYSSVRSGFTLSQYPPAGTALADGTNVLIVISSGGPSASTQATSTPNLSNESTRQAEDTLMSNGLSSAVFPWSGTGLAAGYVVGQLPEAGTIVPMGTPVVLIVAK